VVLLRKVIGDVLRARRQAQQRTLREVSTAANVSLGYLSEIERGHKEASSELLAAICEALGTGLSEVLSDVAATLALAEQMADVASAVTAESALSPAPEPAMSDAGRGGDAATGAENSLATESPVMVTEGDMTVSVRSDGPLRTTLTAKRTPGPRHPGTVLVG
jgi:transcriptional regulator with XRE-family HTH domain